MQGKYVLYNMETSKYLTLGSVFEMTRNYTKALPFTKKEDAISYLQVNSNSINREIGKKYWIVREIFEI